MFTSFCPNVKSTNLLVTFVDVARIKLKPSTCCCTSCRGLYHREIDAKEREGVKPGVKLVADTNLCSSKHDFQSLLDLLIISLSQTV